MDVSDRKRDTGQDYRDADGMLIHHRGAGCSFSPLISHDPFKNYFFMIVDGFRCGRADYVSAILYVRFYRYELHQGFIVLYLLCVGKKDYISSKILTKVSGIDCDKSLYFNTTIVL
jgi:hypothetical protein